MGITRTGHHYPREAFRIWRDGAIAEMLPWPARPLRGDLAMRVDYRPQDRRRRDMTGMLDALFHSLEFIHAIEDDSQVKHLIWRQDMTLPVCAVVRLEELRF